ncbi:uncharacterized protein N7483_006197, partial [Penicillium malachiteum]|uniref:uncharacterized protein n=1 Tax=Penicillium malachiteum TaxID=1324776 RepID=UPI002549B83C
GIILVGGLGSSPYLYSHLKAQHTKAGITVIQSVGMKPRTAICRGAVHKGFAEDQRMGAEDDDDDFMRLKTLNIPLPITVTSTIARYSLGTVHYSVFDPTEHDESDPDYAWDSDTCQYVVHNRVTWYIRKGDNVSKIHPVRHSWIRHLKANFKGSLTHSMVQCANSKPPRRVDDTVKPLCGLKFTPERQGFQSETLQESRRTKNQQDTELRLRDGSPGASMEFTFYIDGRKQVSHDVNTEYE